MTDVEAVGAMVAEVVRELGPVDLLVNNAGHGGVFGATWEVDPEVWWRCMDVNVRGPFLCTRAVLPGMIERGRGRIVITASYCGTVAWAGDSILRGQQDGGDPARREHRRGGRAARDHSVRHPPGWGDDGDERVAVRAARKPALVPRLCDYMARGGEGQPPDLGGGAGCLSGLREGGRALGLLHQRGR